MTVPGSRGMRDAKAVQVVWEELPTGVRFVKHYQHGVDLVECTHDGEHQYRTPSGTLTCRCCMGDEFTTSEFANPVKKIVKLAPKLRVDGLVGTPMPPSPVQEALF